MKEITLIFKPTYQCIVQCRHCSVALKNSNKKVTEDEVIYYFKKFLKFLTLINLHVESIEVIWHGGEPMLMGARFYLNIFEKLKRDIPEVNFRHGIQTNLLLYDSVQWRPVFENVMNWCVGTSYDFFTTIRPYNESVFLKALYRFKNDQIKSGEVRGKGYTTVICMVTNENKNKIIDILDKAEENEFYVKLNSIYDAGRAKFNKDLFIKEEDYMSVLEIIKDVLFLKKRSIKIYPFSYFEETKSDFLSSFRCNFSGLCFDSIFHINPYGDLYKCAVYSDFDLPSYGNLVRDDLWVLVANYLKHKSLVLSSLPEGCSSCDLLSKCYGGCIAIREHLGGLYLKSYYCKATKFMYEAYNRPSNVEYEEVQNE